MTLVNIRDIKVIFLENFFTIWRMIFLVENSKI